MRWICHQRKKQEESSGLDMANRNHAVQEKQDVGRARIIPGCSDLCATAKFLSPGSRYQNVWPGPPRTWAIPTSLFPGTLAGQETGTCMSSFTKLSLVNREFSSYSIKQCLAKSENWDNQFCLHWLGLASRQYTPPWGCRKE